jgi:Skp family chaperone for outer membrane proteins
MKLSSRIAAVVTVMLALALPSIASAQKVGAANIQKIFTDVKETKDLETKLKARGDELQKQANDIQGRVQTLKQQRDQFKAGSEEYNRANQELNRSLVQAQIETQVLQQELAREQKRQTKAMFDKVITAVGEVAKEKQYSIIVAQIVPPEPSDDQMERLNVEQLINLLRQQNILYLAPESDITAEVITRLDAAYASQGK